MIGLKMFVVSTFNYLPTYIYTIRKTINNLIIYLSIQNAFINSAVIYENKKKFNKINRDIKLQYNIHYIT